MKRCNAILIAFAVVVLSGSGCSSTASPPAASSCVPGQSSACGGAAGCTGFQVCQADGTYAACECGGADTGSSDVATDSSSDAADTTTPDSPVDVADTAPAPDSAADVADAADAGPLSPKDLPGLSLWLDGDKGVSLCPDGGTAQIWADQSPNANTAKTYCSGGPTGFSMLLVFKSDIKGHDALGFGGSRNMTIKDDPTLQFGTGPFALVAVISGGIGSTATDVFVKSPGLPKLDLTIDTNINVLTPSADSHSLFPATGYHVVVVRGPSLEIRVDGVATKGKTSTDDLSLPGGDMSIGHSSLGGDTARDFHLAEFIAVKGAVTDAQVTGVESYLKSKYKFVF